MASADRVVLVDAMSTGRTAGTVVVCDATEMASVAPPLAATAPACHLFGIADVLAVARRLSREGKGTVASVRVVGVEGQRFDDCDTVLSDEVRAALPGAVDQVLDLIEAGDGLRAKARTVCEAWMSRDPTTVEVCTFRI